MTDPMRGEDAEAVAAAARAATERDEIALRFAVALATLPSEKHGRWFDEDDVACRGYEYADAFLSERARQRKEPTR